MAPEQDVDFKPFFDMVIGILFILLILVATQLFFTRWQDNPPRPNEDERLRALFLEERAAFWADLERELAGKLPGLTIDRDRQTLGVPLSLLVEIDGPRLASRTGGIAVLAEALARQLGCLPQQRPPADGRSCRPYKLLALQAVKGRVLAGPVEGMAAGTPAQGAAAALAASLIAAAPDLLALRAPDGRSAFPYALSADALAGPPRPGTPAGQLELNVDFAGPYAASAARPGGL